MFGGLAILVVLLLVVCAANVATLLMVRGEECASLLAVHAALGATRLRVGAQLFAEAALIALGGGVLGLAGGFALLRWMQLNLSQHWGYYWMTMEVRLPVVLGTFVVVLITTVLAGTAPAGLAVGFTLALFVAPLVGRFVSNRGGAPDALLLGVVVCGMLAIGVIAALEPAARAARLDPQVVLRSD